MQRSTRKIVLASFLSIVLLTSANIWEAFYDSQPEKDWLSKFERRLHDQERKADEVLMGFGDSVDMGQLSFDRDIIFVGLRAGKLFFWTNEIIGMNGLYDLLPLKTNFAKINNSYYEIRRRNHREIEYIALLHIKDDYPYTNKYIKNHFGEFLHVRPENVDHIAVSSDPPEGGSAIRNIEGEVIFHIKLSENYKERSVNYILLSLYLFFFFSLFYIYNLLLRQTRSLKRQLLIIVLFAGCFITLHHLMYTFRLPESLYRLKIFDREGCSDGLVLSVGDLLLSVFALSQVLHISFAHLKIDVGNRSVRRYRYAWFIGFLILILGYMTRLVNIIQTLIEEQEVYLNVTRIIEIDALSIVAFFSMIIAGLVPVIFAGGVINMMKNVLSLKSMLIVETIVIAIAATACLYAGHTILFFSFLFVFALFSLAIFNGYVKRKDIQRSIFLLIIFLLSVYIVLVERHYEKERELIQRRAFAEELINERDDNFEEKLLELDTYIRSSAAIKACVAAYDEEGLNILLQAGLAKLSGYNYLSTVLLCRPEDVLNVNAEHYNCHAYFNRMLQEETIRLGESNFYAIDKFDGEVAYIGQFMYGDVCFTLRFHSADESEGKGYPRILSRRSVEGKHVMLPYSYAKYKQGRLIKSSGLFTYYKSLDINGDYPNLQQLIIKDNYSHMVIPVDKENILILSLHADFFTIYYLNVLYVFFICILFSSYDSIFNLNSGVTFRKGTLKARIKDSILALFFSLFALLTFFSILATTKSYEKRHYIKVVELLQYLNKELETLDCVDYRECPDIEGILAGWSEVLMVDINIYSDNGRLVATSRPEIFLNGFAGFLVDPLAYQSIIENKNTNYVSRKTIGEMSYMSAYIPLQIGENKCYILNVPYFTENDDLNQSIFILLIVVINVSIIVMVLAFILSGIIADRVTKPLQLVNDKLKQMRLGGKNEKIDYDLQDEVGGLVREYNNMVEQLEESVEQLSRSERETAWREMAKQIAHEIKNPLTPMKLNIQFMQRSLQVSDPDEFREKFRNISNILIEQIDSMASIASAFSDFAKISESPLVRFDISEMVLHCVGLFENNVAALSHDIEPNLFIFADKQQIHRLLVNIIKNAVQSIPERKEGKVSVRVRRSEENVVIFVQDNGIGIPEEIRAKIYEPNFTTKTKGTGLGLAISKRIVENMGGTIDFISTNEGTEFIIALKLHL